MVERRKCAPISVRSPACDGSLPRGEDGVAFSWMVDSARASPALICERAFFSYREAFRSLGRGRGKGARR
jgi:hypothetical protein